MKKILIFVSNGFESLELAPFLDVFGWNNIISKFCINPIIVSLGERVKATWNLEIIPEIDLKREKIKVDEYEALVIPGGFGKAGYFNDIQTDEFKSLLYEFQREKKMIVGICTGALALAINGVLKDIPATTYLLDNERYFSQLGRYGAIPVKEEIVKSGNIITSSGPNTAIKVAFYLLESLTSKENRERVEKEMGF